MKHTLLCDNFVQEAARYMLFLLVFMCVCVCFACVHVCASSDACLVPKRGQKMVLGPPELKLQKIVVYHLGSGN